MGKAKSQEPNSGKKNGKISQLFGKVKSLWSTPPEGRFLTLKESGAFGVYTLGVAFIYTAVNYVATAVFIPYFYNIIALHGYIILAVGSFFNMCILPFIANKIEKTKSKWGKYKPYILFSLPLYAILTMLVVWIPQMENETTRVIYAYLTCIPCLVVNGFFYNMYQTMPSIITSNTQERADLMTPLGLIFGFAPSILQIIAGPVRSYYMSKGQEYMALRILGIISVILGILCVLFIIKVKERVYYIEDEDNEEKVGFVDALKMLAKNKPLIILTIALVLGSLREFTVQFRMLILQCRFAEDVNTSLNVIGLPMTLISLGYTVAMILLPLVTRKMERKWSMVLFGLAMAVPNLILAAIGYQNIPLGTPSAVVITLLHFLMQISPIYLLIPIMLGEIADYQQYKTGKRLDGHIQNLLLTVPLLASQVLMIVLYILQNKIGFEPSMINEAVKAAQNNADAIIKLPLDLQNLACEWFNIVSWISAVSSILMVVVMLFYPLSKSKHSEIVEKLKEISTITNVDEESVANDNVVMDNAEDNNNAQDAVIDEVVSDIDNNADTVDSVDVVNDSVASDNIDEDKAIDSVDDAKVVDNVESESTDDNNS